MKKQYITINQAASRLGVSANTLRRWEEKGILIPKRSIGNQRRYLLSDIEKREKKGFTINEAAARLYVSANTLRRWEEKGIIVPKRTLGNQRIYTLNDIKTLEALHYPTFNETSNIVISSNSERSQDFSPSVRNDNKSTTTSMLSPQASEGHETAHNTEKPRFFDLGSVTEKTTPQAPKDDILRTKTPPSPIIADEIEPIVQGPASYNSTRPAIDTDQRLAHFTKAYEKYQNYLSAKKPLLWGVGSTIVSLCLLLLLGLNADRLIKQTDLLSLLPFFNTESQDTNEQVLQAATQDRSFALRVSIPAQFLSTASVSGKLTAPNIIYSILPGENITITGDPQNPTISASISDLTDAGITAGTGVTIDGTTITNDDPGSAQNIFKNIKVGSNTISAGSNTDTLEFTAGSNISLSTDTSNKKITISSSGGGSGISGISVLEGGTTVSDAITKLDFLGGDFDVGESPSGEANIQLAGTLTSVTGVAGSFSIGSSLTVDGDTFSDLTGNGLALSSGALSIDLDTNPGLEVSATGLTLLTSCADNEILKYTSLGGWACASDSGAGASVGGSGATNQIAFWSDASTLAGNSDFYWNNAIERLGIGTNGAPLTTFDLRGNTSHLAAASISAQTSAASLIVDNTTGDLFTASSSGLSRFTIAQNGTLYTNGIAGQTLATASCVTTTNGIVTGTAACTTPGSIFLWNTSADGKALIQGNTTQDLLIGGTATGSAKFAILNVAGGTPTASLSGTGNNALAFTGDGTIQTTNAQSLTLGGGGTGNIVLSGFGTGIIHSTNGVLSSSAVSLTADVSGVLPIANGGTNKALSLSNGGIVWSDADSFEILGANANAGLALVSGGAATPSWFAPTQGSLIFAGANGALSQDNTSLFFNDSANRLGIGTTNPLATLDVNGTASFSGMIAFADGASSIQANNNNTLTLGGDTTGNIALRPLDGQAGSNVSLFTESVSFSTTTTLNASSLTAFNTGALSLNTTGALTLDSSDDINLDADGADILFKDGGSTFATFTNSSTDLLINAAGNNVLVASGDTLNVGSGTGAGYNSFATALTGVDLANNADDLFIGGALEVNGNARFDGSTITLSAFANCTALTTSSGSIGCSTTQLGSTWDVANGTLYPKFASIVDVLVGGTASSSARFHAYGSTNAGTTPSASVAASSTFAALVIDNSIGDIFAASSAGQTRLSLASNGELRFYDADQSNYTGFKTPVNITNNAIYTFPTGLPIANDYVLISQADGTLSWGNAGELPFVNYWDHANGAIYPKNAETYDLLLGSTATSSAEFAITGIAAGTPTASLSATTNGSGLSLSASDSTIQSLNYGTLTLGGNTTGNIALSPKAGTGRLALTVGELTINGSTAITSVSPTCVSFTNGIVTGSASCGAGSGGSVWTFNTTDGTLYPINNTMDLLFGGVSTASARFAFLNNAGGTPVASISANNGANALTLSGDGGIGTTNKQTLTLGTTTTGDVNFLINAGNNLSINGVAGGDVTANCVNVTHGIVTSSATCPGVAANYIWQTGAGTIFEGNQTQDLLIGGIASSSARFHAYGSTNAGTTPSASVAASSTFAGLVVDNTRGDLFTASSSGLTRFVINQNGNVGIGTTTPSSMLHIVPTGNQTAGLRIDSKTDGFNSYAFDIRSPEGTAAVIYSGESRSFQINSGTSFYSTPALFVKGSAGDVIGTALGSTGTNIFKGTATVASIAAQTSFSTLVVDNGIGDIFTASSSGLTRFTINQNGTLTVPVYAGTNSVLYVDATTGVLTSLTTASVNQCLVSGSNVPSWVSCSGAGSNWDIQNGIITPKLTSTLDFLIGSHASASAKFAVINVNGSASPVASISATTASGGTGSGIAIGGNGTIQSFRNASLTLGGDTTGNIVLNPRNGTAGGFVGPATDNVTDLGASPSARFRSLYLGPGSLHVGCTTGDGCTQGTDFAVGINTTTGDLEIGVNGNAGNKNAKIKLGQDSTTTFTGTATSTNGTAYASLTTTGNVLSSDGTNLAGLYGGGTIELARSTDDAYIDLKTNSAEDYDVRLEAASNGFGVRTGSSGTRSFFVDSTGNLYLSNYNCTANTNGGALTVNGSGLVGCTDDDGGAGGSSPWDSANGTLAPKIVTQDLLIGGVSTASATFHVFGSAGAASNPVASISGNTSATAFIIDNKGSGDLLSANSNGLNRFTINQAGNIGIGTTGPQGHVQILDTLDAATAGIDNLSLVLRRNVSTNGTGPGIGFTSTTGADHLGAKIVHIRTGSNSQGDLAFYTKGDTATGDTTSKVLSLSATNGSPTATVSANTSSNGLAVDNRGTGNLFQALSNGGARFTITQAGKIGIGTTNPSSILEVNQSDTSSTVIRRTSGQYFEARTTAGGNSFVAFSDSGNSKNLIFGIDANSAGITWNTGVTTTGNGTTRMTMDTSGQLGIGGTPSQKLTVTGGAIGGNFGILPSYAAWNAYGVGDGGAAIYNDNGTYNRLMLVGNDNAGSVRRVGLWDYVTVDGRLGIGNGLNDPSYPLDVFGNNSGGFVSRIYNTANASGARLLDLRTYYTGTPGIWIRLGSKNPDSSDYNNGSIVGLSGGVNYQSNSDIRLKENITPTHYTIDDIMKIQVADFNYIAYPTERTNGFLAQQLYTVYPPAVGVGTSGDDLTETWGVDYGKLTPLLVKGIQDQQGQLETLKTQVTDIIADSLNPEELTVNNLTTQNFTLAGENVNTKLAGLDQSASTSATLGTQITSIQTSLSSLSDRMASAEAKIDFLETLSGFSASSSAELSLNSLEVNGNILTDSLNVLGYTTMNELSVTGSIRTGVLTINGQSAGGASISTLNGDLRLQDQGFGGIDILDGLVTIDTSGNITTQGTITAQKFNVDTSNTLSASVGQGTLPLNATSALIYTTAVTNDSRIFVTPRTKTSLPLSVTTQVAGSYFKVELTSPALQPIKFDWWIVN